MRVVLTPLLLALVMVLSGCAGDDEGGAVAGGGTGGTDVDEDTTGSDDEADPGDEDTSGSDDPPAEEPPEENETSAPRDPVTWNIAISGFDFVDGSITIQVGDTVTWTQEDSSAHTVTADDGSFDSGTMTVAANTEFSHTFTDAGEFPYFCEFHAGMTDTITALEVYEGTPD